MHALDQPMSFVFGPPAQELQLLHTVPSIFDGDLISFLDEFIKHHATRLFCSRHQGKPIKLSIDTIPNEPQVITVNHLHDPRTSGSRPKPVGYLSFCVRSRLSQMMVKGTKKIPRALEKLPEFNDDGTFPNSLHEDVSYCTILPICQIPAVV
ncbi:hypothetical protein TNCV_3893831 [Trichonephila clavipes]|nr:hypothetical protein TNCV_3893831 [Trichonephila clavipes]